MWEKISIYILDEARRNFEKRKEEGYCVGLDLSSFLIGVEYALEKVEDLEEIDG